jgi:high affinity Mn2+ porin
VLAVLLAAALPAHAQAPAAARLPGTQSAERPAVGPDTGGPDHETWQARFQTTYVRQNKPPFRAAYSGPNSLATERERSYSLTATAMFGARPWRGAEVYVNPEMALGLPLSELRGLGGFPNAELARTAGRTPVYYLARLFLRQTWSLGGEAQRVESDQNQLAGWLPSRRVVATVGLLPVIDLFDDNAYNHDGRTQFMNWSIVTHAAFDFAADARGYSRGAAIEWVHDDWALRLARFAMPTESNGAKQNLALGRSYGDQLEVERGWRLGSRPGRIRLLAWRNRAEMGSFADALALAAATATTPDVAKVRRDRAKVGWGVNFEQSLGALGGVFLRASRNDGRSEAFAYTEVDHSVSGGVLLDGSRWGRERDSAGLAVARNGLSKSHRDYLGAGGLGFFLGDGRLGYRPETVLEAFYSFALASRTWASVNLQRIENPGHNADRGPVNVYGVRLHANF